MTKRKTKIIKDKKARGEWAESVFIARASEQGLPVSKPWGDSNSFDCVVGRPGKFVAVQVKSTIATLESGKGYICSTCSCHKAYRTGAFDFVAAYVIPEDVWYIIPAREIRGLKSISLCTGSGEAKYEKYREAWNLLRDAAGVRDELGESERAPGNSPLEQSLNGAPDPDWTTTSETSPVKRSLNGAPGPEKTSSGIVQRRMQNALSFFRNSCRKTERILRRAGPAYLAYAITKSAAPVFAAFEDRVSLLPV